MKKNVVASVLTLFVFTSLARADLTSKLILDLQTQQKVTEVEVGASPTQIIQFKNPTLAAKTIQEAEINLSFNRAIVESIAVTSHDYKLIVTDGPPGVLLIRLSAPAAGIKVAGGRTVELCRINFHVNQSAPPRMMLRLFNWSGNNLPSSVVRNPDSVDITGALEVSPGTVLAGSAAPEFIGVSRVRSENQLGISNPGNTLVVSWAKGLDLTPPVTYRLYRKAQGESSYQEIAALNENQLLYVDTGLENGREYVYYAKAIDSTTPTPNVQDRTSSIAGIPVDLHPTEAARELTAVPQPEGIFLKWVNPTDADFAGVVIAKDENRAAIESLGVVSGRACVEGNGSVIYIGAPGETSFLDASAAHGVTSYYKVFTFDGTYNYSPGKITSARAVSAPTPVVEAVVAMPEETTTTIPIENPVFMPEETTTTTTTMISTTTVSTTTTTTAPAGNGTEPAPSLKIYFNGRPYTQAADFSVSSKPEIKIEVLAQSYELLDDISHYSLIIDGNVRCPLQVESFTKNKIMLKAILDQPLAPGKHVCAVTARSAGLRAAAASAALEAVVTVSEGNVLLEPPRTFPNPWDPKNGSLTLQYYLNKPASIEISIYKIDGQLIKKSFVNEQGSGRMQWTWDGRTDAQEPVSSGMYMVIIASRGEMLAKSRIMVTR